MKNATTKKETKQERTFDLEQAFALWKNESKSGKTYFTGGSLVGFYNGEKKNPKEPDLRVYTDKEKGTDTKLEECASLWVNVSEKTKKKYLSGVFNEKRVVGFIYSGENEKAPYLSVYYQEDKPEHKEQKATPNDYELITDVLPF